MSRRRHGRLDGQEAARGPAGEVPSRITLRRGNRRVASLEDVHVTLPVGDGPRGGLPLAVVVREPIADAELHRADGVGWLYRLIGPMPGGSCPPGPMTISCTSRMNAAPREFSTMRNAPVPPNVMS